MKKTHGDAEDILYLLGRRTAPHCCYNVNGQEDGRCSKCEHRKCERCTVNVNNDEDGEDDENEGGSGSDSDYPWISKMLCIFFWRRLAPHAATAMKMAT